MILNKPQEPPVLTLESPNSDTPAPVVTVEIAPTTTETPESVAETAIEVHDTVAGIVDEKMMDTVAPVILEVETKIEENSDDILKVMKWQTEAQQILEQQTVAIQSISEVLTTMGATLAALLETANREAPQTPSVLSVEEEGPERTEQLQPEAHQAPDNKPEKAAAKRTRAWM